MPNATEQRAGEKAERDAQEKTRRRVEQAHIIEGLSSLLEGDEQLLGFARGRIAGGWRGKLNVGPEAFFAPIVNIGLTERRLILQHIHADNDKPSQIMPHLFPMSDIRALSFADIETFSADLACRMTLRLNSEQQIRLRLVGVDNFSNARAMVEVFQSLHARHKPTTSPTQSLCASCGQILDQPSKFCPYCGHHRTDLTPEPPPTEASATEVPPAEAFASDASATIELTEEVVPNVATLPIELDEVLEVFDVVDMVDVVDVPDMPNVPDVPDTPDFPEAPTAPEAPSAPVEMEPMEPPAEPSFPEAPLESHKAQEVVAPEHTEHVE